MVVHQSNKGVGSARNIGLSFASGEIIGWVDSDDYVHEDYFEVMVKNIEEHDVDISMCDVVVEREGRFRYDYQIGNKSKSLNVLEALELLCVDDNCKSWLMNKCFKRNLFEGISFPERKVLEDYSILHEIFSKARGIFYTRETFYCYEENPTSLTHHVSLEDRWSWVYPAAERYEFIKKNWPSLKEIAFNSFIEIVDGCFITAIEQGFDIDFWSSPERKEFLNKYKHEIILNIFRGDNIMCVWRRRRFVLFSYFITYLYFH